MNIGMEKAEVLERVEKINDLALIRAIKNLLDFGLTRQAENEALEQSIQRGLNESKLGQVRPHQQVMAEFRERYKS
jgi:predicted transcriptional regulator